MVKSYLNTDLLARIKIYSHGPNTNFELDDLARWDLLLSVVWMERKLFVDGLLWKESSVAGAQYTHTAQVQIGTLLIFLWDFLNGFDARRYGVEWEAEMHEKLSIPVALAENDEDVHIIVRGARHVQDGLGQSNESGLLGEGVGEVRN